MIYYILKGQIFTVFLSIFHLTAVSFEEKVRDYVGGQERDFKIYELNKNRSLVFESKRKGFDRNFIAFLKGEKFHFNLVYNESLSNKDIEIKKAEKCQYFSLIKETKDYQLFECPKSLYFVNKSPRPVQINGMTVSPKSYLSKGPPIYLDGKIIYYEGQVQ